jgi:hypothetical protein
MPLFYFDTSAILKRYKSEKGSDVINELFERRKPDEIFVSSLLTAVEVFSSASRMLKGKVLTQEEYDSLTARFLRDFTSLFQVVAVDNALIASSVAVARDYQLRTADAIHFATIRQIRAAVAGADNIIVVTGDERMIEACRIAGIEVINPEEIRASEQLGRLRR